MTGGGGVPEGRGSVPTHLAAAQALSDKRFLALAAFALLSTVNGYTWLLFEPIESVAKRAFAPNYSASQTALLGSWQPAMYMLLCIPITKMLLRHNGLTRAMRLAIVAELAGAFCKLASVAVPALRGSPTGITLINVGQMLSAVSSPVAIGAPSQVSAEWFPPEQRTRATSAGVLSNNVGNAVVYLCVPLIAGAFMPTHDALRAMSHADSATAQRDGALAGMTAVFVVEAVLAMATAALIFTAMPVYTVEELLDPAVLERRRLRRAARRSRNAAIAAKATASPDGNVGVNDDDDDNAEHSPLVLRNESIATAGRPASADAAAGNELITAPTVRTQVAVSPGRGDDAPVAPTGMRQGYDPDLDGGAAAAAVAAGREPPGVAASLRVPLDQTRRVSVQSPSPAALASLPAATIDYGSTDGYGSPGVPPAVDTTTRVSHGGRRNSSGTGSEGAAPPLVHSEGSFGSQSSFASVEHGGGPREDQLDMLGQLRHFATSRNALLLFAVYAWTSGAFIAWTALFDHLLIALRLPFSEEFIGRLSFASTIGYVIGGTISGVVTDRYFGRRMKLIIVTCCIANTMVTYAYSSSLPVDASHAAITAAEEAIAVGNAFGRRLKAKESKLGGTGAHLVHDHERETALNATEADALALDAFGEQLARLCGGGGGGGGASDGASRTMIKGLRDAAGTCGRWDRVKARRWRQHLPAGHGGGGAMGSRLVAWFEKASLEKEEEDAHGATPIAGEKPVSSVRHDVRAVERSALRDALHRARAADSALASAVPSKVLLASLSFLGGAFNGASAPLFYELTAEVTFPFVGEAVSGNLMSMGENLGALLFFQGVAAVVADSAVNWCFVAGMAVCTVVAALVRERYARKDAFELALDDELSAQQLAELDERSSLLPVHAYIGINRGGSFAKSASGASFVTRTPKAGAGGPGFGPA